MSNAGLDWKTTDVDSDNPLRVVEFKSYYQDNYRVDEQESWRDWYEVNGNSKYFQTLIGAVAYAEKLAKYGKDCRVVALDGAEA